MDDRNFTPRDLLSASAWSSLLFTTYSLSLSFVEAVPLAAVSRSVRNFTILADLEGYMSSLSDVGAIGVGRDYDLVPIKVSGGVFHPKISMFADEDGNVRATVGSGNLSFGGWGYNNEVLELLRPGRDSRCFADIAGMFEAISAEEKQGGKLECLMPAGLDRFIELANRSASIPGAGRSRMLHTMGGSLVPQIREMADELGGARKMTVVSPFFSAHHGIKALAEGLGCGDVSVAVPPLAPSIFDFASANDAGIRYTRVLSPHFNDSGRSLHSKLYDIECESGRLVVTGSANASTAALLGRNVEAVVVRPESLSLSFGWEATTRGDSNVTNEREPREASGAGLIVDYNGGVIVGRVLGHPAKGEWEAVISSGTTRGIAGTVKVGSDGRFRFEPPANLDPLALGASAQVILLREEIELRGWLILRDLIRDISRRGPIARAMARMASGLDTVSDVTAILEYFAKDPQVLFDAAERTGGGKAVRKSAMPPVTGPLSALQGVSALDMQSTWSGGDAAPTGDGLIEALVRRLAEFLPDQDDGADDDDDTVAAGETAPSPKRTSRRGRRVPRPMAEKAFEHLFKKLEEFPVGSPRAPGLFALFDMMIHIVPRTETPDELLPVLMRRWIRAADKARPTDSDPTSIDQCMCIIAAMTVIGNPSATTRMHAVLQSWFGGELTEDDRLLFEPTAAGTEERRIYPRGIDEEWNQAWAAIIDSRTPWSVMKDLRLEIAAGATGFKTPEGATASEITIMRRVAAGEAKPEKIAYLTTRRSGSVGCPGCYSGLPSEQGARLNKHRLATCTGMRCSRIIIDVSL